MKRLFALACVLSVVPTLLAAPTAVGEDIKFPKIDEVTKDYTEVVSTADGKPGLFKLWKKQKEGQMLAMLPTGWSTKQFFFAMTVSAGETFAGLQAGDQIVTFKQYGKRLAMIEPNFEVRASAPEAQTSVKRIFTDRVILDVPIVAMGPNPVIDLDALLLGRAATFFGGSGRGVNAGLATITKAKSFAENAEIAFEAPASGGRLKTFHYSISALRSSSGFKPRMADARLGYFTTAYQDLGKYSDDKVWVRYINRWHLEKADPKLNLSPPKNPITFYIEHTTPIRYRRFVRDGILLWNKAFKRIGIDEAIVVHYQDKTTGAHMEKDPEDVQYNFVRWLNNDVGTAIGPSRVNPYTGEILDADIVLTDGWIRHFDFQFHQVVPHFAMQGFTPETLSWLDQHPRWDPRLLSLPEDERQMAFARRQRRGPSAQGGHELAQRKTELLGDEPSDGLAGRVSQVNGYCSVGSEKAFDLAMLRATLAMLRPMLEAEEAAKGGAGDAGDKGDGPKTPEVPKEEMLDGIPERFIGPLLADLVGHEVGHTLGLRHNFKGSSLYSFDEINSATVKGKPFASTLMDYIPINFRVGEGVFQGDLAMTEVGPYDLWAIEYGYTLKDKDADLKKILAECTKPEHAYATDEDTSGPDPLARRYDFAKDPLDYAQEQLKLAQFHRTNLLEKFVKDGDSWSKARRGYDMSLSMQTRAVSMMGNWLGGAFISRHKKGDGDLPPIQAVDAAAQRAALKFAVENTFRDEAFGLSPDLLKYLSVDKWWDGGGMHNVSRDATYPVHDRILTVQGSVLTLVMNPTVLRRIFDNEALAKPGEDVLTLAELLRHVADAAWTEVTGTDRGATRISSLRRNLQREHAQRLIDLALDDSGNAASQTIASLARLHLRRIADAAGQAQVADDYTRAHLQDVSARISKALDAAFVIQKNGGGGFSFGRLFGKEEGK